MSNAPTRKCWTCAKPMFGVSQSDSDTGCPCCSYHSCGECCVEHARKAHPSWYMENWVPAEFKQRLENKKKGIVIHYPDAPIAPVIAMPFRAIKQTSR